jgi:hypothetical protein
LADPIACDQSQLVPVLARPADDQCGLMLITTEVQDLDARGLHLLDDVPVVSLAWLDRFKHRLGDPAFVEAFLGLLGEIFAVSLPVVENGDWFVAPAFREKIAGEPALKIVAANHAEDVGEALCCELRIGVLS